MAKPASGKPPGNPGPSLLLDVVVSILFVAAVFAYWDDCF
jgi:hypothetical protein